MRYLKTAQEVIDYTPRVSVPTGKELAHSTIISRMIDAYLGRSLSIQYYLLDFELSMNIVGRVPIKPILQLSPTTLATGFQVRPLAKTWNGGRREIGQWVDVEIPTAIENLVNPRTGRVEIYSSPDSDFGRVFSSALMSQSRGAYAWLAKIEIHAGHLVDTRLSSGALAGATSATLASVVGITAGSTILNFGDDVTAYTVTSVDPLTKVVGFTPAHTAVMASGLGVTEAVPEAIKVAAGQIIDDRMTYEPNTLRMTSQLDVIVDRLSRIDVSPIPLDAQYLLASYKNS